jgi:hypothetical protein
MQSSARTVPEVLADIVGNIQEIIRSEFRLAKAEVRQEAAKAYGPLISCLIGGIIGLYAGAYLIFAAITGLATLIPTWAASLIVSVVLALVASLMLSAATKKLKQVNAVPERTVESLKENVQWAKDQIK